MNTTYQPGKLVSLRGRDWIVLPSVDPDLLVVKPLGGSALYSGDSIRNFRTFPEIK